MFYSHVLLAKKSPLGAIWIAAHLEHRIKRPQIESINIPSFADKIMMSDVPIALRLSGHLLLGLARIYSWKVNHLFSDCNRLVTSIRKAFAAVTVDLPIEEDHAPFESVTLPETFDLNALDLDLPSYKIDEPDTHIKSYNQITMSDQIPMEAEQYVAVHIDEEDGVSLSHVQSIRLNQSPQPTNVLLSSPQQTNLSPVSRQLEDDTLPPFEGALSPRSHTIVSGNASTEIELTVMATSKDNSTPQGTLDTVNMLCDPGPLLQDADIPGDIRSDHESGQTFSRMQNLSTISEGTSIPEGNSLPGVKQFVNAAENIHYTPGLKASPEMHPPVLAESGPHVKRENVKRRKRKQNFDRQVVLSNMQMKKQLDDTSNIVCKRRKLPGSHLDVWKFLRLRSKDNIFHMPLFSAAASVLEKEIETPTKEAFRNIEWPRIAKNTDNRILQLPRNERSLSSESLKEMNNKTPLVPEEGISPAVEPIGHPYRSPTLLEEYPLDDLEVRVDYGFDPTDEDPNCLNANEESLKEMNNKTPLRLGEGISPAVEDTELPNDSPNLLENPLDNKEFQEDYGIDPIDEDQPLRLAEGISPAIEATGLVYRSSTPLEKYPLDSVELRVDHGYDHTDEDLNCLNADGDSPGLRDKFLVENLSARTKAVANYLKDLKDNTPIAASDASGRVCLNTILENRTRKQCSRMFFETLVLKSCGLVNVEQKEAYGDILISPTPSLLSTKF